MKIGRKKVSNQVDEIRSSARPARNQSKKGILIIVIVVITALLIAWVYSMGRKATETVTVCMTASPVYKNQQITENMLQPYDMVKAEYEKYAVVNSAGNTTRRILLWSERNLITGAYAAYPLLQNTLAEYRAFYTSKIDNSETVLYSFPGKEIVSLDVATSDLQTFKTFLEPGDRIVVTAIYTEQERIPNADAFGGNNMETVTTYRTETMLNDIYVADLLNQAGDSILDIYADYNGRSVTQQAALDASQAFQDKTTPRSLLVALTPEEKELYYYYLSKSDCQFRISLPQRVE